MPTQASTALARVRKICLALDDVVERPSHGQPSFFWKGKRCFVMFTDNHHGDGRLALWCAAPPGAQAMLVDSDAEVFFVPPYVGKGGWVGMRLDRGAKWPAVAEVVAQAYEARRTKPR